MEVASNRSKNPRPQLEKPTFDPMGNDRTYRELAKNAHSIILRMDKEGRIIFINEFAQKFFGFSEYEILGKHVVGTIVPKTDSSGTDLKRMIKEITQFPERYALNQNENILHNGEKVWIAWTNIPILHDNGHLKEILSIGNDITDRQEAEKALIESEEHYRTVVETSNDGVAIGAGTKQIYVNQRFAEMFGYESPSDFIGNSLSTIIHPDDIDRLTEYSHRRQKGEHTPSRYEFKGIRKDGTSFLLRPPLKESHIKVCRPRLPLCETSPPENWPKKR